MVPIPAGRFLMGSPANEAGRKADEGPQVEIVMDAFHMAECEVTWSAYNEFLDQYKHLGANSKFVRAPADRMSDAVTYPTPIYDLEVGPRLQRMGGQTGDYPAVIMSRFAARQYTKWLSKKTGRFFRLPTEAEWEYACRAGTNASFHHGGDAKEICDFAWFYDNSEATDGDPAIHRVRSKRPNAWGLYDMHGNAAEWVIDAYDADWLRKLAAKGGAVGWRDAVNFPTKRYPAVARGGNFEADAEQCRSAARFKATIALNALDPDQPKSPHWDAGGLTIGFRIVAPVVIPSLDEQNRYWNADDPTTIETIQRDREIHQLIEPPATRPAKASGHN